MKRELDTKETIRVVTSNDFITLKGLEKLSLKARKLLYLAVSQCKKNDRELYEYVISVKEFAKLMDIQTTHVYQEANSITDELCDIKVKYINNKGKEFDKMHLFRRCKYSKNTGIYFKLEEDLEELYLNLQGNFSQPLLDDFMRMKRTYSMAIWHICQREMKSKKPTMGKINNRDTDIIEFDLSLQELREVTGTANVTTYNKISNFKNRILNKSLEEIERNCMVSITYEDIKQGRTVTGFHCKAKHILNCEPSEAIEKIRKFKEKR